MRYLDNTEQAIGTLTYRISQLERKLEEQIIPEARQTNESLRQLRQQLAANRIAIREDNQKTAAAVTAGILDWKDIAVPPELMIGKSTRRRGKRRTAGTNRTAAVVAKRWALWKVQREQGYTLQQIARAWGCNHSSVVNAEKNKFRAGYIGRRK